jgi:hypothetical protein
MHAREAVSAYVPEGHVELQALDRIEYVPEAHCVHEPWPLVDEYVPAEHGVHEVWPVKEDVDQPGAHGWHKPEDVKPVYCETVDEFVYDPAAHGEQLEEPAVEEYPKSHCLHTPWLATSVYEPAGQFVHVLFTIYCPILQIEHPDAPTVEIVPFEHGKQSDNAIFPVLGLYVLTGQLVQLARPKYWLYVPVGHCKQSVDNVLPVFELYVPGAHEV